MPSIVPWGQLLVALQTLFAAACLQTGEVPCWNASSWPDADLMFRRDPRWLGADGAYSVDLGDQRTLWLFADTWIDTSGERSRVKAKMIRNSVGLQKGTDPSSASIEFFWREDADGEPAAFFPSQGLRWRWPGHGIRLHDRLILFHNRLQSADDDLGFASVGWGAVMIDNPDDDPSVWRMVELDVPASPEGVTPGFASVLRRQQHVYAFGTADPVKSHPVYAVRWDAERVHAGDLSAAEWWAGEREGWVDAVNTSQAVPIFDDGQSELTIHFDEGHGRFLAIQTVGFGAVDVALRTAEYLTGPWSQTGTLYRPPEIGRRNIMIYAAKAHPQLTGADLVVTYATNSLVFADHFSDGNLYYPRFVRLNHCRHGARGHGDWTRRHGSF